MEPIDAQAVQQDKLLNDLSRSLTPFEPNHSLITVIELSKESWLVAGIIPGEPLKKLPADEDQVLKLLERWRTEAEKAGERLTAFPLARPAGLPSPPSSKS